MIMTMAIEMMMMIMLMMMMIMMMMKMMAMMMGKKSGVICGRLFCCLQVRPNSSGSRTSSLRGLAPILFLSHFSFLTSLILFTKVLPLTCPFSFFRPIEVLRRGFYRMYRAISLGLNWLTIDSPLVTGA